MPVGVSLNFALLFFKDADDGGVRIVFAVLAILVGLIVWIVRSIHGPSAKSDGSESDRSNESFHAQAEKEASTPAVPRVHPSEGDAELAKEATWGAQVWLPAVHYDKDKADAAFEEKVDKAIPPSDRLKSFYVKVAGVNHRNNDGTSRHRIIKDCEVFECLNLVWEADNKFDPNAIAIRRFEDGAQLGYLDSRLAEEVARSVKKEGPCWTAIFRHHTYHPDTGAVVGAVLYMIRFSEEYLQRKASEKI